MYAVYWLIASAVFLLVEIMTLGLTSIWFAGWSRCCSDHSTIWCSIFGTDVDIYRGNMSVICTDKTSCQTIFKQQGAKNEYRCIDRTDSTCQRNDQ